MTSAIGSSVGAMGTMHRPDPSRMASRLFSKLDTKNQGYIEKSDLESALSNLSPAGKSDGSASADEVFSQFDADSDGKITESEMSSGFRKLAQELDSQFGQMRMREGMGGMQGMPPPPQGDNAGFTKDELSSQLQDIGSTDSKRASLISSIVDNFDQADSDGDGKVSFKEAMAFKDANSSGSPSDSSTTAAAAAGESSQAKVMHTIMQLMHAYGNPSRDSAQSGLSSLLSVSA